MENTPRYHVPAQPLMNTLRNIVLASCAIFVVGLFVAPTRVWGGYLMGFHFLTALALSGTVFMAFLFLSRASWAAALQRILEAMTAALPIAGMLGLGLLLGLPSLYEWAHPAAVEHDSLLQHKSAYLNTVGFSLRMVVMFAIWIWLSRKLVRRSRKPEFGGTWAHDGGTLRLSVIFIALFAITYSVANFDWLMSLEPHWFSTVFALYQLGGLAVVGIAATIIIAVWLERRGPLKGILRDDHVHDMAKMLFAVSLFWAYIWYCQYMLIWYADIPEETGYYVLRKEGSWWLLVQASLFLKWGVPFLSLMARWSCRSRTIVVRVAAIALLGHAVDLFTQVGPSLMGEHVSIGIWEVAPVLGAVALFFMVTIRALSTVAVVPERDERMVESMHYHTT